MARDLARELREAGFRGETNAECDLARYTTWRIGGPAELLAHPADRQDLLIALAWCARAGVPWRVMGNGSNLLVRDRGVRGLVLRLRKALRPFEHHGSTVIVDSGASFPWLSRHTASLGLSGLEFGAGIPGTVGGAVIMNAGWHEHEIGRWIVHVEYARQDGSVERWPREACQFGYRSSRFRHARGVVLGAELRLEPGEPEQIRRRLEEFAASRKAHQPTELPSCGSVFLKPPGDFAGRLIEQAGLKGLRVGDAQVSPKHANFIVNLGRATSADVLTLVEQVEREVRLKFGVDLVREFEVW